MTYSIFPNYIWIFLVVSLLCCSIGFKKFVWFMSIGYGLASAGIGITLFILSIQNHNILFMIQCILFIIYGIRLGGFLLIRELKSKSYQKKMKESVGEVDAPIFVKFIIWIILGFLYVCESSGPIYRLLNGASNNITLIIGIIINVLGITIETIADNQKSASKKVNPNMCAMQGLYKYCRCPNYFGELLFWTGSFISAFGAVHGYQWILVIIGYLMIIYVMMDGAKRVEARHIKYYGHTKEYHEYADKTPLIFPFIPLYHLNKETTHDQ